MNSNEKKTVEVVYNGFVHIISMEEFEGLRDGWLNWRDLFE